VGSAWAEETLALAELVSAAVGALERAHAARTPLKTALRAWVSENGATVARRREQAQALAKGASAAEKREVAAALAERLAALRTAERMKMLSGPLSAEPEVLGELSRLLDHSGATGDSR
jgi:hypothetical protein